MSQRYKLKHVDAAGKVTYGLFFNHVHHKNFPNPEIGHVYFEDGITGVVSLLAEAEITDIKYSYDPKDEYEVFMEAVAEAAYARDTALQEQGLVKGRLAFVPKGDGCAIYEVLKVNKKNVRLGWRGFEGDRWVDNRWGYADKPIPREDVELYV